MAGRSENGGSGARTGGGGSRGVANAANQAIFDSIKAATCASDEDIKYMLQECEGDVNEAVNRLMDNPFEEFKSKKDKRKTKKPESIGGASTQRADRRDAPNLKVMEVKRGGYGGGRASGRGGRGDRGDRSSLGRSSAASNGPKTAPISKTGPVLTVPTASIGLSVPASSIGGLPQETHIPDPLQRSTEAASQPPAIKWGGGTGGSNFADVLRRNTQPTQASAQQANASGTQAVPATASASLPDAAAAPQDKPQSVSSAGPPVCSGSGTAQTFAEKLSAAAANAPAPETDSVQMPGMSAPLQGGFQQPTRATEHTALDIPASTNWGAKSVSDVQTDGLAGLLAGKGQEDSKSALPPGMSGTAASTADALSLQFGQFDMRNAGMGDFGAGFGSGFGDELGVGDAQAHTPINSNHTTKAPEPDAQKDSSGFSPAPEPVAPYQPTQGYSYSQPPSAAIATLGQVPKATDAVPGPAASAAASSHLPAPPYYSQPNAYQFTSQPPPPAPHGALCPVRGAIEQEPGSKTQPVFNQMMRTHDSYPYFMQSQGRVDDFPPSSAPAPSKFGSASRVEAATSLGSQEPPTSSAAASSAPAAAQFQQPMVPQMPSYPSHGMPPGMAAQYGYLHHAAQYPYMHNANVFMYPNYPHPAYAGGAGYPPQGQATSFPPIGSTSYPSQVPSGGPLKYNYPYAQGNSQTPVAGGLQPGGYGSYGTNQGNYGSEESAGGVGYSKDSKESLYGANQGVLQMGRDTPYAYMAGQGYQQQGFNAGAQGQYGNSSYAQQYMAPYALGAQAQPPHMSGQTGSSNAAVSSAQSSNIYKMQ